MPWRNFAGRKKHLCYYGYARTNWYRIACPICNKVVKSNLPGLIFLGFLALTATTAAFVVVLKF